MEPLVSVIMPTIRPAPRWKLMLDSLENQTFKDFEYIIVDGLYDQRKDEVNKILKDYSFPIVYVKDKPWYHSEEEQFGKRPGPSSARNTAIIHARGELLAFHDDNTWLPPKWLSRHVNVFNERFDGMAGLSYGICTSELLKKYVGERCPSYVFEMGEIEADRCGPCQALGKPCTHLKELRGNLKLVEDYRRDYDKDKVTIVDENSKIIECHMLPLGWLYTCNMSISTKYALKVNGFAEEFCGEMGNEDPFFSVCVQRAGAKLLLDKESYVIHISDEHHVSINEMFNFKNKEVMLMDGKMHFSREKFVEDLLFKEPTRYRSNPHLDLTKLRDQKLQELYGD